VTIEDDDVPSPSGLTVTPSSRTIALGETAQFSAFALFSNAPPIDVSDSTTWSSSNPGVATVSAGGLAGAVGSGTTTITATRAPFTATASLVVRVTVPLSIEISPLNPSVPLRGTVQFMAIGRYSGGTSLNLTSEVQWLIANPAVALRYSDSTPGLIQGFGAGETTVTASYSTVSASTTLTVVGPPAPPPPPVRCRVPKVAGKPLAAAKTALQRARCATGKVTQAYSRKVKKGRVLSQSRRAGAVLPRNTKVNLVVSRGPKPKR
jgi:Bacterial Ig-like domain (group 2)/PASTA domain